MQTPRWHFSRRRPGKARESQTEKFFRSDVVADQTNALIREGIQNSLDAGIANGGATSRSVNVQITFGECTKRDIAEFVPGLFEHLNAVRASLPDAPHDRGPIPFLTFEDFNTTGLTGDPLEWDPPLDNKNAFFNFFFGEGVTGKEGNQRGRHGVGKAMFAAASCARSIFGLTATAECPALLMGASTLVRHRLADASYEPDGWFGTTTQVDGGELVAPVCNVDLLSRFATTFGLRREALPGLSIVVPWLHESVTPASALMAVVRGFYWAILEKRLFVDIDEMSGSRTKVTAGTLLETAERLGADDAPANADLRATLDLAKWAMNVQAGEHVECRPSAGDGAPDWEHSLLDDGAKDQLRTRLLNGEPVAIRMRTRVRRKGRPASEAEPACFRVFLKPDAACGNSRIEFIREGLLIPGVTCRRYPGFRALVVVDEGPLASFLGDAENPSHTEWQEQYVRDKYSFHKATLQYVIQCVPNLLKTLYDEQRQADATLLLDMFSLPKAEEPGPKRKQPKKTPKPGPEPVPGEIDVKGTKPRRFTLQKRLKDRGFVIRRGAPEAEIPKTLDIRVAYATRRGNPFKKYSPADFRLDSRAIRVDVEGGRIEFQKDNQLRVAIDSPEFEIVATGFDLHRDVDVNVEVDPAAEEGGDVAED